MSAQEQTTRVGARSSFEADSGPAASLSRSSASRADHPEAPGVGQVVVGGPARQIEDLLERARGRPARAGRPCGSAGCGSPPRLPSRGSASRAPAARSSGQPAPVEDPAAPDRGRDQPPRRRRTISQAGIAAPAPVVAAGGGRRRARTGAACARGLGRRRSPRGAFAPCLLRRLDPAGPALCRARAPPLEAGARRARTTRLGTGLEREGGAVDRQQGLRRSPRPASGRCEAE